MTAEANFKRLQVSYFKTCCGAAKNDQLAIVNANPKLS